MTEHDSKFAAFVRKIKNLDVCISVNNEGVYTACSGSEPYFCFDGYSQQEVADRAINALESYAKVFFGLGGLNLRPQREDVAPPSVKLEVGNPVSKFALAVA